MSHFRNCIFTLVVALTLLSPAAYVVLQIADIHLPEWLKNEELTYLSGGLAPGFDSSSLTLEGILDGSTQTAIENSVGNNIPAKSTVLLCNAALQRAAVCASNELFGWEYYPTQFGNSVVYLPEYNLLSGIPLTNSPQSRNALESFGTQLAQYANNHPDKLFCVVIPDCSQISNILPSSRAINQPLDAQSLIQALTAGWTTEPPNLILSTTQSSSADEFVSHHYHTDGHWNGYGALEAYNQLMNDLPQLAPISPSGELAGPIFNGQNARNGLMLLNEAAAEPIINVSNLSVRSGAEGWLLSKTPQEKITASPLDAEFNFYASWYGTDTPTVIDNEDIEGQSVILVSDSYGDAFRWLLAQSFGTVYNYMDLYSSSRSSVTLDERIAETSSNIIVFLGLPSDYISFIERHPNYFSDSEK